MMGRRGRLTLALGVTLGATLGGEAAEAAPQRRDEGPLYTHIDTGQAAAAEARALAAKGQCDRALDAFDRALHSSIDMSIRRDRGLCQEQLGHPFPAMDDYRAYLVAMPNAPDSDDIRVRLERLEVQTGVGGPSANAGTAKSAEAVPDEPALAEDSAPGTSDTGKRKALARRTYDEEEDTYHKFDQAVSSALRRGTGAIFGVYTNVGAYLPRSELGVPSTADPSVEVGGTVRWSFDSFNALYGQIGYVSYQQQGNPYGGIGLGLGYELRLRLDEFATNSIVFGVVAEYQRLTESDLNSTFSSNIFLPVGKLGYRLVVGPGIGFELTGDFGPIIEFGTGLGLSPYQGLFAGGTFAFLLAF
jgi:hypothetical protein